MPQFSYKAKQGSQKIVDGVIEANSMDNAVSRIIGMGYTPLDVVPFKRISNNKYQVKKIYVLISDFFKKISKNDILLFTRQTADLVSAGVPLLQSLEIVGKKIKNVRLRRIVDDVHKFVEDGGSLSDGLASHPQVFSNLYVNIVRSGEVGGNLSIVLNRLADFNEKEQETKSQIMGSLLYPAFILVVGILVVFVLMTWVIPQITLLFEDMSEELPLPTVILISISNFCVSFWWVLLLAVVGMIVYFQILYSTEQGELWIDGLKLKIPLFGEFIRDAEIGRFARTLGTLMDNGVVINTALESVQLVVENAVLRRDIEKMTYDVVNGMSLTAALKNSPLFQDSAVNMITIGEESGKIHEGLFKLAVFYERQTQRIVKGIVSLLGPCIILLIGLIVGSIVIAMLMPILKMNTIIS